MDTIFIHIQTQTKNPIDGRGMIWAHIFANATVFHSFHPIKSIRRLKIKTIKWDLHSEGGNEMIVIKIKTRVKSNVLNWINSAFTKDLLNLFFSSSLFVLHRVYVWLVYSMHIWLLFLIDVQSIRWGSFVKRKVAAVFFLQYCTGKWRVWKTRWFIVIETYVYL